MKNQVVIHDASAGNWLHFNNVQQIITADTHDEVLPALRMVEEAVEKQGLYAAGCISYEASPAFDSSFRTLPSSPFPLLWFGLYTPPDHITPPSVPFIPPDMPKRWTPSVDRASYDEAISDIKECISRGETYQVNYTFRLHAAFTTDPWLFFLRIAQAQKTEYAAYLDMGRFAVCSASPELFFRLESGLLTTRPMKGTASRGRTLSEDAAQAEWLSHSEKNRAENIMIVDMIRNDLGRVARIGTVNVPRLFDIERYPTVWQMTSTVTAESDAETINIISALFPCASITGAPKSNTTGIIARLETTPRNIYTGCIGFITPERKAQFSVAIRTVLVDREREMAEYGVGGGIVWDSSTLEEYDECRIKAQVLWKGQTDFSLLETILHTPGEKYFLLPYHLRRLSDSAEYFGIPLDIGNVVKTLEELTRSLPPCPAKIRLIVSPDGTILCESSPLADSGVSGPVRLKLASQAVDSSNPYLFHKTTNREVYESTLSSLEDDSGFDDVLLWNEREEITETTIANVIVRVKGFLYTPPVACGLLPGTYRAWMLEQNLIREKIISLRDLRKCDALYVINSVRKKQEAILTL